MKIIVKIGDNVARLILARKGKVVDEIGWEEENSMSRLLLARLDELLKRNKLNLDKISDYKIISNVPRKYTSFRIVKMTIESLALAKKTSLC
jgi:tRNA A37 threonylcarbamoyladenosine modification protein TsaB